MPVISNVQVFSPAMDDQHLTARAAVMLQNGHVMIKIPLGDANPVNGGPIVGQEYLIRYLDETGSDQNHNGFRYLGINNLQLEFSTAPFAALKRAPMHFPAPEP